MRLGLGLRARALDVRLLLQPTLRKMFGDWNGRRGAQVEPEPPEVLRTWFGRSCMQNICPSRARASAAESLLGTYFAISGNGDGEIYIPTFQPAMRCQIGTLLVRGLECVLQCCASKARALFAITYVPALSPPAIAVCNHHQQENSRKEGVGTS